MLNLCITFDHELYFGENFFPEEEILINPTYEIVDILDRYDIKATFFTDVCSIDRHKRLGLNKYPELMEKQLRDLISKGHDVQLHIHPNWYKSDFIDGKWKFDTSSYRIHYYGFEPKSNETISANTIIKNGKEYLENLITPIDKNYKCIAYRAGGFCIQPEKELFKVLIDNDIRIDSSVAKGLHYISNTLQYSFRNTPKDINWWINPEEGVYTNSKDHPNSIFEVSIGTINRKPHKWFISKKNIPFSNTEKKGTFISENAPKVDTRIATKVVNRVKGAWNNPLTLSLDSYRAETLIKIVSDYIKHNDCSNKEYYIAIIGHPKLIESERSENLEKFVKLVTEEMPLVKFTTMQDVYKCLLIEEGK